MTARCSQIGEIVCFPWGAENFTTICVSNCVCRSSAKDYSGVRHFRESTDRTGFEPEPSAPLSEKTRFFSKKMQKSLSICKKKLNKGVGRSFAVWSSAAKLTRMTHRARVGRGPCCRGSEKSAFFTKERFYSAEVMTRVSKKTGSGGWVSRPTKGEI